MRRFNLQKLESVEFVNYTTHEFLMETTKRQLEKLLSERIRSVTPRLIPKHAMCQKTSAIMSVNWSFRL